MPKSAHPPGSKQPPTFESALKELEDIVHSMDQGELPLEGSLSAYQRGMMLLKYCQDQLGAAEQKIRLLDNGTLRDLPQNPGTESD